MSRKYLVSFGGWAGIALVLAVGYAIFKFEQATRFFGGLIGTRPSSVIEVLTSGQTVVMRTPGGTLEVARIKAYETLRRTSEGTPLLGGLLDTGTTVSEIDVPVLFRYHVPLAQEWPIRCSRDLCVVRAGAITPTLPPAIYTAEMRKRTASGWARFDKDENLAALEKSLTQELSTRAASPRNVDAATDAGRRTVKEFVDTWLLKNHVSGNEPKPRIVVLFPGETSEQRLRDD
jgi:hypothetical protein